MIIIYVLAAIASFSLLVFLHEVGHFLSAKICGICVEELGFGFPPRIFGKKIGETTYSINWILFGGFVKIVGMGGSDGENSDIPVERSFYHKGILKKIFFITSGILSNFLIGWVLISLLFIKGVPQSVFIADVKAGGIAATAGIKPNDEVANFKTVDELVAFIADNKGKEITLDIKRKGETIPIKVVPRVEFPKEEGNLGIVLIESGFSQKGFLGGFKEGLLKSWEIVKGTFLGIIGLFSDIFGGKRGLVESFMGPVGIVSFGTEAMKMGLNQFIYIFAMVSFNLSVINIFPIPGLDGSWLLFSFLRKVLGKYFKPQFEMIINNVGLLVIVLFMAIVTVKDVFGLF
ncbi:MAG: site-2 protease family protein [Candidatus Pacebacteria bacterium]|nr:site-2 protease family protein [Candidatus Paceibacterota bacterium]